MKRAAAATAAVLLAGVGVVAYAQSDVDTSGEWQITRDGEVVANIDWVTAPTTTEVSPSTQPATTSAPTSELPTTSSSTSTSAPTTTAAPTTSSSTSTTSTSTSAPPPPPTTSPPAGVQFVETFDGNTGLERFNYGVWHRDPNAGVSQWQGDHDMNCGNPATSRTIHRNQPAESFYLCADHMMTSVADTSGYSVAWFSPAMAFPSVTEVSFDVNLTNLGDRKWWKVGVVTEAQYQSVNCNVPYADRPYPEGCAPGHLVGNSSSNLPQSLHTASVVFATRGSDIPPTISIGNASVPLGEPWWPSFDPARTDKMTRFPFRLRDNGDGTITFTASPPPGGYPGFSGATGTISGSFPPCPCRVVIQDHNYTPDKAVSYVPNPYTWHWDNIVVK